MKKVIHSLLIVGTFGLISLSCKKEDPPQETSPNTLPPLTHEGRNTFGCYIDGELFVANDGESVVSLPAVSGSFDEDEKFLQIQGSREIERTSEYLKSDDVRFSCIVLNEAATYELYVAIEEYKGYSSLGIERCEYFHNLDDKGSCTITFIDEEKNIISGTFYMTLINPDCEGDTLMNITDGRFDFRY